MKTRTQRLVGECRRTPMLVARRTVVRVLQSLGVPYPHSMVDTQRSGNSFLFGGLLFYKLSGDECRKAGGFELWDVRPSYAAVAR